MRGRRLKNILKSRRELMGVSGIGNKFKKCYLEEDKR